MWYAKGTELTMCEGDFGVKLPITVSDVTFTNSDEIRIEIKSNGEAIVTKTFGNISQNTVNLELTEAESALLPVGTYSYCLDWYQNGSFLCNIIPFGLFVVGDKA